MFIETFFALLSTCIKAIFGMGRDVRIHAIGDSYQVWLKPACSATETSICKKVCMVQTWLPYLSDSASMQVQMR